ncbi:glutamyl-tRNA(Gln) amidotransferase [Micromonospora qiuiae]|uniref:Glutamyl-tRNA(Gln) amidotransferase n=1 Tax=Micromonospora qiuiae TaxID=502268 RepID=A0ABQ4JHK4_9ACTN|nr:amidase [Micromonospora qiuiae]GIJ29870.1 glutamyl-tRNA(Gln) amidotransferase [Micromonospora qiuiae]
MTPRTITQSLHDLQSGALTATALLDEVEAAADRWDSSLGVYLYRSGQAAWAEAEQVDARRERGEALGPLAGIPLGIKDVIATYGAPTTAQSLIARDPKVDAPTVARLRAAGAVVTGKTSTMEYALGFNDPDKPFPMPRNPWDSLRWTGGSSSGTGSGIAAGFFLGGLGTDTAGSVRMPAAWCGVTGHKPTYGVVPRTGVFPLGWTYDHVGPLARTAEDCALLLSVIAGPDGQDPAATGHGFAYSPEPVRPLRGLRIALAVDPLEVSTAEVCRLTREAAEVFAAAEAVVTEIRLPHYAEGVDVTMLGLAAEALTFDDIDLVLSPTASRPAPLVDGLDFDEVVAMLQTAYWNATGNPALSVPMGLADGMPVGLQIVGRPHADQLVLDAGRHFQDLTDHHLRRPDLTEDER